VKFDAIVLLGCRIGLFGRPSDSAARRADRVAELWHEGLTSLIVVSGGRQWHGVAEANALAEYLVRHRGVPKEAILCECHSQSTAENARYSARLLTSRGLARIGLVTSDWHIARALGAFRRAGLACEPLPALSPPARYWVRVCRTVREVVSHQLDRWRARGLA
jgi:uncharacterized SAM-binding protein YcdF (DUF218 family)